MKQLNQLTINCEILFGVNDQQINIFHVKSKGVRKSYELIYPKKVDTIQFLVAYLISDLEVRNLPIYDLPNKRNTNLKGI